MGINLIVKAESVEKATQYVNEHLSIPVGRTIPIAGMAVLGYGEVIVSLTHDRNGEPITDTYDVLLEQWDRDSSPGGHPTTYKPGALIWWRGDDD